MGDKNVIVKKKGFSFLSFFIGILIGIIILAGALFGAGYFAMTADLDRVMSTVGLNNKDEEGNHKYVNTDTDNGGVKNALELVKRVADMFKEPKELTLGQIEGLLPVADGMIESLRKSVSSYVELDAEELRQVKFADFGKYMNDKIMEIRPSAFISGEKNRLVELLLDGVEADCVTFDNAVYPLYEDESGENFAYKQGEVWYCAQRDGNGFAPSGEAYTGDAAALLPTGNFYFDAEEKIYIEPITIGSLTGTDGMGALGRASVTELLGETEENGIVEKLMGDITINDFMNGEFNLDEKINSLEISDLVDVRLDDKVMVFFAYGLSGLTQNEDGGYTAVYKLGDEDIPAIVTVEDDKITAVTDVDGNPLAGLTVENVSTISDKIDVSVFLDVSVDNKVVAYIAYGITGITAGEDGSYTAVYKSGSADGEEPAVTTDVPVIVEVKENAIISVKTEEGELISAANVSELSDRVDGMFDDLQLCDLIEVGDNKILQRLGNYTLNTVSEGIDEIEITDVMDVPSDSALLPYIAYGLTKVDAVNKTALIKDETGISKTVYLDIDEEGKNITGVYETEDKSGEPLGGTKINDINARIDGLMDDLTIGELIPGAAEGGNTILRALRDSTVNTLSDDIDNLTINELYADEIYGGKNEAGETQKAVMKKVVLSGAKAENNEIDFNKFYIYYTLESGEFGTDSAVYKLVNFESKEEDGVESKKGKLDSLPADKTYYTYGKPTHFWQLLVTQHTEEGEWNEHAYTLNGLTKMIDNIQHNMNYFTLGALQDAGILVFKGIDLDETIIPEGIENYGGKSLGELTVPDAVQAMVYIIEKLNSLGGFGGLGG